MRITVEDIQLNQNPDTMEWSVFTGTEVLKFPNEKEASARRAWRKAINDAKRMDSLVAENPSAIVEWETRLRKMVAMTRELFTLAGEASTIMLANGLSDLIDVQTVNPENFVGDSTISKQRAQQLAEAWLSLAVWQVTPLPGSGKTPVQVIFERDVVG